MTQAIAVPHLPTFAGGALDLSFRWRDRGGIMHDPRDMETRHLHNVLRMIWNNFMPPRMQVGAVRRYSFGPSYTAEYLRKAIGQIGHELQGRGDLSVQQRAELREMAAWFHAASDQRMPIANAPKVLR